MKIVIVGAGRVGYAIAEQLLTEGHDITVVEGDPERAAYISSTLDVIVVEGRANVDQLRIANVADADLLIAATTSDETNLISCMVGRKLGATHTIARVRDEEYYQDVVLLQDELGLTYLFIAHDLSVVRFISDRIAVIYKGVIVEVAETEELFNHPIHPYTQSLLSAVPIPDPILERKKVLKIYDPEQHDYSEDKPQMVEIKPGHYVWANKAEENKYRQEYK